MIACILYVVVAKFATTDKDKKIMLLVSLAIWNLSNNAYK